MHKEIKNEDGLGITISIPNAFLQELGSNFSEQIHRMAHDMVRQELNRIVKQEISRYEEGIRAAIQAELRDSEPTVRAKVIEKYSIGSGTPDRNPALRMPPPAYARDLRTAIAQKALEYQSKVALNGLVPMPPRMPEYE